jgi:hypothetical protein
VRRARPVRLGPALALQRERDQLQAELDAVRASRWVRLGRAFGIGPEIHRQ